MRPIMTPSSYLEDLVRQKISRTLLQPVLNGVVRDLAAQVGADVISARFHNTIARMVSYVCLKVRSSSGIRKHASTSRQRGRI